MAAQQRVGREVYTRAIAPLRLVGAWVVIFGFVFTVFVEFTTEVTIYGIGSFDVSIQKIVAAVIFPLGVLLMGHIRISLSLVILAGVMILANSAAYVIHLVPIDSELLSLNVDVVSGFVGAIALYTALTQSESSFSILGRVWAAFAAGTSIIIVGQTLGLLPLWAVPADELEGRVAEVGGLMRGTGLQFDPNYQALALVIGIIVTRFYVTKARNVVALVIALGLIGTFSRMGLLIAGLAWVLAPAIAARASGKGGSIAFSKVFGAAVVLTLLSIGFYTFAPQSIQLYLELRMSELSAAYDFLAAGASTTPIGINSAEQRILLFTTALHIFSQNYLFGVGASRAPDYLSAYTGWDKTVHNTYLDELLIGGLLGALAIALYVAFIVYALFRSRRAREDASRRSFVVTLLFAFGLLALFLTLNYNAIMWFPLVITLAHWRLCLPDRYVAIGT
jgi:O-antigen ligase